MVFCSTINSIVSENKISVQHNTTIDIKRLNYKISKINNFRRNFGNILYKYLTGVKVFKLVILIR